MLDYLRLIAPRDHGGVLVAPDAKSCAQAARANNATLRSSQVLIAGKPLASWRIMTRQRMNLDIKQLVIAVGHQPDFIHPGVWAKNVVASRMARVLEGRAVNIVVDSDAPKRISIRVPVHESSHCVSREIHAGHLPPGRAYEQLPPVSKPDIQALRQELVSLSELGFGKSLVPDFLRGLESSSADWVTQIVQGRKAVEAELGVEVDDLRIREAWWSPLAIQIILDGRSFALAYNDAIEQYRKTHKVKTSNRPIPPLSVEQGRVEAPFWSYDQSSARRRVFLSTEGDTLAIYAEDELIATLSRDRLVEADDAVDLVRQQGGWRLRPRALVTTIWARLFLADLFIHGIGGAKYDRISDRLIAQYFGCPPPQIACVTATLYLDPSCPLANDPARLEQESRDIIWNPERHLSIESHPDLASLIKRKEAAVAQAAQLKDLHPANHSGRKAAFLEIHRLNEQIHARVPQLRSEARSRAELSRRDAIEAKVRCDREYFFALQPRSHLEVLLTNLPRSGDFL